MSTEVADQKQCEEATQVHPHGDRPPALEADPGVVQEPRTVPGVARSGREGTSVLTSPPR
ncbi:hypothetical protein ACFQMM_11110 [Saliphagus sp. GCM10025308]